MPETTSSLSMIFPSSCRIARANWPSRIFGPCATTAISFTCSGVPFLVSDHRVLDVVHVLDQTHFAHVDLLQAGFDEAAAGIGVVVGELLLHLADAEAVGDQLVGIDANLIFARGAAEAGHIHDVGNGLEVLLDHPVFERLQLHHVVRRIGAVQREEIDLADRAPVGSHLRRHAGGKRQAEDDLRQPLQHSLAVPGSSPLRRRRSA